MMDYFFEKEDCMAAEDSLRTTLFSDGNQSLRTFKEEYCDIAFDWKNGTSDFNVDELLGSCLTENGLHNSGLLPDVTSISEGGGDEEIREEDFEAFKDIANLPFEAVMNSLDPTFEAASDSGMSTDNLADFMLSPSSGTTSPGPVDISIDTTDDASDVSSTSDLGSMGSVGSSPSGRSDSNYSYAPVRFDLGSSFTQIDDDVEMKSSPVQMPEKNSFIINRAKTIIASPQFYTKLSTATTNSSPTSIATRSFKVDLSQSSKIIKHINTITPLSSNSNTITTSTTSSNNIVTRTPIVTKVCLDTGKMVSNKNGLLKPNSPQTIVVTQPGKGNAFIRNTFINAAASGRPILVPVNVNDLNQMKKMKSIKIISTSTANNRPGGIRTLVSAVRPVNGTTNGTTGTKPTTLYTTTSKGSEGRSFIKVTPTAFVTPNSHTETPHISVTPSYIKEEPSDDEDETPQPNQQLELTDEEKRLMRKEGLTFPSRYPLTKQEERDLKRIRRKIRNKISAQDSRKRKKEYVDGLEDRVKISDEENQQLRKKIKILEKQNESIIAQLKKFQNLIGVSLHSKHHHTHASTALMMLILSTALFVVPSLRSQDGKGENELAGDGKIPSTGHTRSLLEVKNAALNMKNLEGFASTADDDDLDSLDYTSALSDHDYAPFAKKVRLENLSPAYYQAPSVDKTLPRENGDPPDSGGGLNGLTAMIGAMLNSLGNNWTDPGGSFRNAVNQTPPLSAPERSVVVNLNHGKLLRDDIELE